MATARITLPGGAEVRISGSPEDVAQVLEKLMPNTGRSPASGVSKRKGVSARTREQPEGPTSRVLELKAEGFFKAKRTLKDVRLKLEEAGHIYPRTTLSPTLIKLVRQKKLRRIRQGKSWTYVS